MRNAVTFGDDLRDAISFTVDIDMGNGEIRYADIPQSQVDAEGPNHLSLDEVISLGIDISQLRETECRPAIMLPHESENESGIRNLSEDICISPMEQKENLQNSPEDMEISKKNDRGLIMKKLPDDPLPGAKIHTAKPADRKKFLKSEDHLTASKILDFLESEYKLRLYKNDVYIFDEDSGEYKYLSDHELDLLISKHYGDEIKKKEDICIYYLAQGFLKREYKLNLGEDYRLPLKYWPFRNGFLDIYSGELIENDGSYFVRNVLKCNYNPDAECPEFDNFIYSAAQGDPKLIKRMWQTIGYLLSTDTNGKVFFAFIGQKDTGKSLLARVLSRVVGEQSVSHLSASDFSGRFDISNLNGMHLNVCMDLPNKALSPQAVAKIKMITGGDKIYADVKNRQPISFISTARLLFGSNSTIRTELWDEAFNERQITIPFNNPVPKEEQDFRLEEKLLLEAGGICRKAIEYYKELVADSYRFEQMDYLVSIDEDIDYTKIIKEFAQEYCEFTNNPDDKIASAQLHLLFEEYCRSLSIMPLDMNTFSLKFRSIYKDKIEKKRARLLWGNVQAFSKVRLKNFAKQENAV